MEKLDISVNLCTYNRLEMLRKTLASLLNQQTNGEFSYEIIVVDDGSTDGTSAFMREIIAYAQIPVRYFREEHVGVAGARNKGVKESLGEWIAFIDDDEIAELYWLQELMTAAQSSCADCVGGSLKLLLEDDTMAIAANIQKHLGHTSRQGWVQKRFNYPGPGTGNALVKRTLFEKVGLFDTSLRVVGEDQDFFRRVRQAGYKTIFTSKALVHHITPAYRLQPPFLLALARQHGQSLAYFDCREWGGLKALLICGMRLGDVMAKTVKFCLIYTFNPASGSLLSLKCSLYNALAYTKETVVQLCCKSFSDMKPSID